MLTVAEIKSKVRMYQNNVRYDGAPVLFLGEYLGQNPNGEGVIFEAIAIYKTF